MTIQRYDPVKVHEFQKIASGGWVTHTDHLAAMQRERECREKLVEALKQVEKDRAYQKLSGGLHFSSASTEMEWKAESAAKTRKMVEAALAAAKELE